VVLKNAYFGGPEKWGIFADRHFWIFRKNAILANLSIFGYFGIFPFF
jgi:hypothetical protein